MSQRSLDVEYLHTVIASLEVALQDKEDEVDELAKMLMRKQGQCEKCKIRQKKTKDELAALKSALNGVALLGSEEDCGCGGNCQQEGCDC